MRRAVYARERNVLLRLLVELRLAADLSQGDLAARLGVSQSEVSKHERGERGLDFFQVRFWLSALGVPMEVFVEIFENELSKPGALRQNSPPRPSVQKVRDGRPRRAVSQAKARVSRDSCNEQQK